MSMRKNLLGLMVALITIIAFVFAGCTGEVQGESEIGTVTRAMTDPVEVGGYCWDLLVNGLCDVETEDVNGDGRCSVLDCRGANGVSCWDLNEDGQCQPEEAEFADDVAECDVNDCRGQDGQDGADGQDGEPGADGESCSGVQETDGCLTVTCGTIVYDPICPGQDGADGQDGQDGYSERCRQLPLPGPTTTCPNGGYLRQCGLDLNHNGVVDNDEIEYDFEVCHGSDGQDGESCTVTDNLDGSYTMECPDGTTVTWNDGEQGPAGNDGSDGQDGQDGEPCTVMQESGICTMTCPDGTDVIWVCEEPIIPEQFDDDGDCYCESDSECVDSVNPACDDLFTGDCDDEVGAATLLGCYNPTTGESEVVDPALGCSGGYGPSFSTDESYLVNPGAIEVYNGIDDNCNGQIDEGFCTDDSDCAVDETCNTETGLCEFASECDVDVDCDDTNDCTIDICNAGICEYTNEPEGTACGNNMFCNSVGVCAYECLADLDCDDGLYCNGEETCGQDGMCVVGEAVECPEGEACSNSEEACVPVNEPGPFSMELDADGTGYILDHWGESGVYIDPNNNGLISQAGYNDWIGISGNGSIVVRSGALPEGTFCMCHQDGYTPWACGQLFTGAWGCATKSPVPAAP